MKALKFTIMVALCSIVSHRAFADNSMIEVQGRFYDPTAQCLGYPSTETEKYEFLVSYQNKDLPWGTSITLLYGFGSSYYIGDGFGTTHSDWVEPGQVNTTAVRPYTWQGKVTMPYPHNLNPSLDQFQIVLKIQLPDGRINWENGGSAYGHIAYEMPKFECNSQAKFTTLPIYGTIGN